MNSNLFTPNKILNNSESYSFKTEKNSIQDLRTAKDSRSPSLEETECSHNLIARKTLRGRKEKIPLPKNKLKCEICLQFSDFSQEDLLSCSTCKCLFHKSCYDEYEIVDNSTYKCIRCIYALKENKSINEYKCFICGTSNKVLNRNTLNNCFYHKICLNMLNEFIGLEGEDICKENIRKWRYKNSCRYCGEKLSKAKAVIKCKNPKCKEYYHIPCAIEKGMIFDLNFMKNFYNVSSNDEIPFYCSNHNKKLAFMYKTHVRDGNNDIKCRKNLFKDEFDINENEEKKTFFDLFEDLNDKNSRENAPTIVENEDEKIKTYIIRKNSNALSIIEERKSIFEKEDKETQKDTNPNINMDIDDSFDNNNVFKLDFDKYLNENDKNNKIDDECSLNENFCYDIHCHKLCDFNSKCADFKILSRKSSFDDLKFNI